VTDQVLAALGWGALAASSLVVGAVLALVRTWSATVVGLVLGFGAGALIASVSFELAEEGLRIGSAYAVAGGLALGGLTYVTADRLVERWGGRSGGSSAGAPLAVGAFLDGIPEQAVLGIGIASGEGVSAALVVAIFASNLPEAIGSAADMRSAGRSRRSVLVLWTGVAVCCALATLAGTALADAVSSDAQAFVDGFAAGALLTMLIDSMVPEAKEKAKDWAGLATVVGFALAAGLSLLGG
jgi:ZIP family zinc transporter